MNVLQMVGFVPLIVIILLTLHVIKRKETAKWKKHYEQKRSVDRSPYIRKDGFK